MFMVPTLNHIFICMTGFPFFSLLMRDGSVQVSRFSPVSDFSHLYHAYQMAFFLAFLAMKRKAKHGLCLPVGMA